MELPDAPPPEPEEAADIGAFPPQPPALIPPQLSLSTVSQSLGSTVALPLRPEWNFWYRKNTTLRRLFVRVPVLEISKRTFQSLSFNT